MMFVDSETRSPLDVTAVGAYSYACHSKTDCLVWGYSGEEDGGKVWSPDWAWQPDTEPEELLDHAADGGYLIAWNAFFDRWIWNAVMVPKYGWPKTDPEQWLCAQAQAEANNLPGKLEKAAETLGTYHRKDPQGKRLINLLCNGTREDWDAVVNSTPERMGHFRSYCLHDVLSTRDVWQHTRPLTQREWDEYHASERINDRGVAVDVEFAAAAKEYASAEFADINGRLMELTETPKLTVTNHVLKARWLNDQLWPDDELQQVTVRPPKRKGGPERLSCDRSTREAVLEMLNQPEHAELFHMEHREKIIEFLELIEAGNSAAVRKFTAIVNQERAGRVRGQYSFNGAGQTGRFSSRGIQIHNLIRDPVDKKNPDRAIDAVEAILDGAKPDDLVSEFGFPISRLLARLIRPTFIAPDGRILVWADYDQIEGRTLPWLAASQGSEAKLDLYRRGIDTYRVAAMPIYGLTSPDDATDSQRQVGKVAELALGFGGAIGAFSAMARGYGVVVPEADARQIVDAWRAQNSWCVHFWHELWEAAMTAHKNPGTWWAAGRVAYLFHPTLMHGTLICRLPSGRWIVYPQFKHERYEEAVLDDEGVETGRTITRWRTTFVKGFGSGAGRVELWYGTLAENITQATAADMLRLAIKRMDLYPVVVLHTHDEIVCECEDRDRQMITEMLTQAMTGLPEWAEGLPLSISVEHGPFYTK